LITSIAARALVAACVALSALTLLAGSAAAEESLRLSPSGEFTATSEGAITFQSALISVNCSVTLSGRTDTEVETSVARLLPEGIIGEIDEGRAGSCRESFGGAAEARFLITENLLANLRYDSFLGTLPSITGVLLTALAVKLQISTFGLRCLYEGAVGMLITFPPSGGANSVRLLEPTVRLVSGSEGCAREGTLRGRFRLTPEQTISTARKPPCVIAAPQVEYIGNVDRTITPDVVIHCNNTTINNIRTERQIAEIAINDRETAIGRTYNDPSVFRYDLRYRVRAGTADFIDRVRITTSNGNWITRVVFQDT